MNKGYIQAALVATKALDGGQTVYTFRATTEAVDSANEIVTLDGWDFARYEANPVILDSHNYHGIENIVGRAIPPLRKIDGAWECDVMFADSERGRLAKSLCDQGMLRAVSVGFMPKKMEIGNKPGEPLKHTRKELLEISVVPVPANQEALRVRGAWTKEDVDGFGEMLVGRIRAAGKPFAEGGLIKAGRTLSAKNEAALREAATLINGVLEAVAPKGEDEGAKAADEAVVKDAEPTEGDAPVEQEVLGESTAEPADAIAPAPAESPVEDEDPAVPETGSDAPQEKAPEWDPAAIRALAAFVGHEQEVI